MGICPFPISGSGNRAFRPDNGVLMTSVHGVPHCPSCKGSRKERKTVVFRLGVNSVYMGFLEGKSDWIQEIR